MQASAHKEQPRDGKRRRGASAARDAGERVARAYCFADLSGYTLRQRLAIRAADLAFYAALGFRSATTFGVFLDTDYFAAYGPPPVAEYGHALRDGPIALTGCRERAS